MRTYVSVYFNPVPLMGTSNASTEDETESEFSRILTVISEWGTWNVKRDESHFRDVHLYV